MAEMNEREIIRCFEEIAKYDLPAETVEQHLQDVRERLLSQTAALPTRGRSQRTVIVGRWVGLAAAAVVIVAAAAIWKLFPSPRLQAAELLTQVAKNMDKLAWLKVAAETYGPDQNQPVSVEINWTDVANKRAYTVCDKKYVHLLDYQRKEWWVYSPDTNDMVINPLHGEWAPTFQAYISKLKQEGVSVRLTETTYRGRKAIVVEFDETVNDTPGGTPGMLMNGQSVKTIRNKLVIDPNYTMGSGETSYLESNGRLISIRKFHMEPTTERWSDIYDLGVPRNVKIINQMPTQAVQDLRQKISDCKSQFLNEYIAVITEAEMKGEAESIRDAKVVFCQGRKIRVDTYRRETRSPNRLTSQYRAELEVSLRYLSPFWPDENARDISMVHLYDGLWQCAIMPEIEKGKADGFVVRERERRPNGPGFGESVSDNGWQTLWWLNRPEHTYEDSYSKDHGLIGMELTTQWEGTNQVPKRLVLYVDPQKDYICHRYVDEQLFDAPWQLEKAWLDKVQNKSFLQERLQDLEVKEYARTSSDQWYPKVIVETSFDRSFGAIRHDMKTIIRVHLIGEHPQFPSGIFDPAKLPQVKP